MDQTEKRKVTAFFIVTLLKVSVSGGYTQAVDKRTSLSLEVMASTQKKENKNKRKQEQVLH